MALDECTQPIHWCCLPGGPNDGLLCFLLEDEGTFPLSFFTGVSAGCLGSVVAVAFYVLCIFSSFHLSSLHTPLSFVSSCEVRHRHQTWQ